MLLEYPLGFLTFVTLIHIGSPFALRLWMLKMQYLSRRRTAAVCCVLQWITFRCQKFKSQHKFESKVKIPNAYHIWKIHFTPLQRGIDCRSGVIVQRRSGAKSICTESMVFWRYSIHYPNKQKLLYLGNGKIHF